MSNLKKQVFTNIKFTISKNHYHPPSTKIKQICPRSTNSPITHPTHSLQISPTILEVDRFTHYSSCFKNHPLLADFTYKCAAVCCSVLQCVAGWCIMLQCVAVCCSVYVRSPTSVQCVAVCCSVLQFVALCCSVLQCVAVSTSGPPPPWR